MISLKRYSHYLSVGGLNLQMYVHLTTGIHVCKSSSVRFNKTKLFACHSIPDMLGNVVFTNPVSSP